jgi:hypothetical protein
MAERKLAEKVPMNCMMPLRDGLSRVSETDGSVSEQRRALGRSGLRRIASRIGVALRGLVA